MPREELIPQFAKQAGDALPAYVDGAAIVYRLVDIGYSIRLDDAERALAPNLPARDRLARVEARTLQIPNLPLTITLGRRTIDIGGRSCDGELSARLYDFGVCALRLKVEAPPGISWEDFSRFGQVVDNSQDVVNLLRVEVEEVMNRIGAAIERPGVTNVVESYSVFRVTKLADASGVPLAPSALDDGHLIPLLLGEERPLSETARRDLLQHRFSYYTDDLTVLTWDNALVIDRNPLDHDVEYVLEFANAQLLELRFYDATLDAELPAMYDRVERGRGRRYFPLLTQRYQRVLSELQARVADVTETVERVENSLKVTDDVYLARIYAAALELFRGQVWRRGIDRKLAIFRETYEMLNAEAQASRAEVLEAAIVVLIVAELILGVLRA